MLLRPVHPLISIMGDSRAFTEIGYFSIAIILIISMLIKLQIAITVGLLFKILLFAIVGAFIIGAIMVLFSVTSFYTYKSAAVFTAAEIIVIYSLLSCRPSPSRITLSYPRS